MGGGERRFAKCRFDSGLDVDKRTFQLICQQKRALVRFETFRSFIHQNAAHRARGIVL